MSAAVFRCARCGAGLSGPVRRVPLPAPGVLPPQHQAGPPLMEPRTYAVDPAPHAAAGLRGTYVLAPGDVHGVRFILENCELGCLGLHGYGGPNLACAGCGAEVGSRTDDCGMWQETRLYPAAAREEPAEDGCAPAEVEEVLGRRPIRDDGAADWLWFGRLAVAAAGALARSGGEPLHFTERMAPVKDFLDGALRHTAHRHALRRLPAGAGEGPPLVCDLGPPHTFTVGGATVPVDEHVWAYLADDPDRMTRTRWRPGLAALVHRDEPDHRASSAEMFGNGRFPGRIDLAHALHRRPEGRDAWLDALADDLARSRFR
ncbi:hypothetical protein ACQP1W_35225 [Spirillospora sp. CA-255316]